MEQLIFVVLDKRDQPRSGRIPSFAKEIKMTSCRFSFGVSDRSHLLEGQDQFDLSGVHIHLPDTRLFGSEFFFERVLNTHIFSSFKSAHPLKIVGQSS